MAFSWLKPSQYSFKTEGTEDPQFVSKDFTKFAIPEFYASEVTDGVPSALMPQFNSYAPPLQEPYSILNIGLLLLQIGLIENPVDINKELIDSHYTGMF